MSGGGNDTIRDKCLDWMLLFFSSCCWCCCCSLDCLLLLILLRCLLFVFSFFFHAFLPGLLFGLWWGAFCAVPNGVRHHLPLVPFGVGAGQEMPSPPKHHFSPLFWGGASPTSWPHGGQSQEAAPNQCTTSDIIGFGALASLKIFFGRQSPTQNALRRPFWL